METRVVVDLLAWIAAGAALLALLPVLPDIARRLRHSSKELKAQLDELNFEAGRTQPTTPSEEMLETFDEYHRPDVWSSMKTRLGQYPVTMLTTNDVARQFSSIAETYLKARQARPYSQTSPEAQQVKVCLVGDLGVGKTSLIRRYVMNEFEDRYVTTLGAKVSKRETVIPLKGAKPVRIDLTLWDIMGSKGFRELLREAFFQNAKGVLAVADLTRPETIDGLRAWIDTARRTMGPVPVVVAVNKNDLFSGVESAKEAALGAARATGGDVIFTSAKTGENVEDAFRRLASSIADHEGLGAS